MKKKSIPRKNRCFWLFLFFGSGLLGGCLFGCCTGLPQHENRPVTQVIKDGDDTTLGRQLDAETQNHPGQSGVILIGKGLDAFVARAGLIRLAERSIDLQYYMFHQDTVGELLIAQLLKAADRDVRVRMLIDDIHGSDGDEVWTTLDAHPNIEVRLFNPFSRKGFKGLQMVTHFRRVVHRMHSKSFTVDNKAAVLGGRNIGDEYFSANPDLAFADLDILAIGPVVPEVSGAFDQYWNSDNAYSASVLAPPAGPGQLASLRVKMEQLPRQDKASKYIDALEHSNLSRAIAEGSVRFQWAETQVFHDSPEKRDRKEAWKEQLLISRLWPHIQKATKEIIIVSPYFVPGEKGTEALCNISKRGVTVRILTNSLASTDVFAVHAGYAPFRKKLIRAGVMLYEFDEDIKKKVGKRFTWLPGLKKSSLHAKTMLLDRKSMFVGSMNLDQLSMNINNEIGILFHNPELAALCAESFERDIGQVAFRVTLKDHGNGKDSLQWISKRDDENKVYDSEPYVGIWKRLGVWVVGLLPVESLL